MTCIEKKMVGNQKTLFLYNGTECLKTILNVCEKVFLFLEDEQEIGGEGSGL